ncbi:MAG: WG repeat-containing protein [Chitinophagaceae bacterium]
MNKIIAICLLIISFSTSCIAQKKKEILKSQEYNLPIIYHPIYNNIQMVEVDLNTHLRLKHIMQYADRDLYVRYKDIHNPIYLRDKDGKVIDVFNDDKREYEKHIKLSVEQSLQVATYHINYKNTTFPNWDRAVENSSESFDFEHYKNTDFRRLQTARGYIPYAKPYKWIYVVSKNNKYGVIDSLGNYVLPIAYKNIIAFKYGYFVCDSVYNKSTSEFHYAFDDQWGFISKDLKHKIPCLYNAIDCIDGKQFIVNRNNKEGIVDISNQTIANIEFKEIIPYKHFYFYKQENKGDTTKNGYPITRCGLIKKDGSIQPLQDVNSITKTEYAVYPKQNIRYFLVHTHKGTYIMDEYGNKLCNYIFEHNPTVNYYKQWQGYIRDTLVNNELREILLDSNFNEIKTTKYYSARHLGKMDTLIAVVKEENGKRFLQYGISRFGKLILDTVYDRIHKMTEFENLLFAKKNNKTAVHFSSGQLAIKDTNFMYFMYNGSSTIKGTKEIIYKVKDGVKTAHPIFECFKCLYNNIMPWKCE